jgi:hypothetical protein
LNSWLLNSPNNRRAAYKVEEKSKKWPYQMVQWWSENQFSLPILDVVAFQLFLLLVEMAQTFS